MAEWNHKICERCYWDGPPGASAFEKPLGVMPHGETYRMPTRVMDDEVGPCCFCGLLTIAGIYVRKHEDDVLCHGRHDDLSWTRVGMSDLPPR